eukprot:scaffold177395_cov58-Attheya_sp.AAC.1
MVRTLGTHLSSNGHQPQDRRAANLIGLTRLPRRLRTWRCDRVEFGSYHLVETETHVECYEDVDADLTSSSVRDFRTEPFSDNSNVAGAWLVQMGSPVGYLLLRLRTIVPARPFCWTQSSQKIVPTALLKANMNASTGANVLSDAPNARIPGASKATRLPLLVVVLIMLLVVPGAHGQQPKELNRMLSVKKSKKSKRSKSNLSPTETPTMGPTVPTCPMRFSIVPNGACRNNPPVYQLFYQLTNTGGSNLEIASIIVTQTDGVETANLVSVLSNLDTGMEPGSIGVGAFEQVITDEPLCSESGTYTTSVKIEANNDEGPCQAEVTVPIDIIIT